MNFVFIALSTFIKRTARPIITKDVPMIKLMESLKLVTNAVTEASIKNTPNFTISFAENF